MVQVQIGVDGDFVNGQILTAKNELTNKINEKASMEQVNEMAINLMNQTQEVIRVKTANLVSQGTLDTMKATIDNTVQGIDADVRAEINRRVNAVQTIIGSADVSESVLGRLKNIGEIAVQANTTAQHAAQGQIDEQTVRNEVERQLQGIDVVSQSQLQGAVQTEITNRGLVTVTEITKPDGSIMVDIVKNATPGIAQGVQGYTSSAQGYATQAATSYSSASQKAQDAINAASNALAAQGAAQGYAQNAAGSASSANTYKTQAQQAKTNAENAAATAENWATQSHEDYIAIGASIQDGIVQGIAKAQDSIVQEVGDMIEGAMENTADLIDFDGLAIPVEQSEDSTNESFNELVSKLQEKPIRRTDVLNKVIDEDAYYWYVMPVIDQRIYRDTVIDVNGQYVTVEYGWQKAVKERYWYHKQDSNIRDHYIYLFRTDINSLVAKTSNKNTIIDGLPHFLPMSGEKRKLRTQSEIPSGMCVIGNGRNIPTGAGQRALSKTDSVRGGVPAGTTVAVPISPALSAKTGKTIPSKFLESLIVNSGNSTRIDGNGTMASGITGNKRRTPFIKRIDWSSVISDKSPFDGNYPSDFYYIGCYAECDDSSMYENEMYTSDAIAAAIEHGDDPSGFSLPTRCINSQGAPETTMVKLSKHDDGSWYFIGDNTEEYIVGSKYRAYYYEYVYNDTTFAFAKVDSKLQSGDEYRLQRRPFADVSRDIQVHMLPIYLLGSTGIAVDSADVDGDNRYNYVTIDSMITPPTGTDATTIMESSGEITLSPLGQQYDYVCKDNIALIDSGLPCVYGQGYTWLPLDAKGEADDEGGLGISNTYTQATMWNVAGIYAAYNGLIPSGYTKSTLKSMSTMYKYKIVEKFVLGQWNTIDGIKQWVSGATDIPIFTDDYSDDGLADLNETIYDINITDGLITYTIKENYLTKQETGGNAGVTHSDFITNTLSYLTEDGATNTNNIFLVCVEDDGDEYIFDEYIIEKGKVFKLNEQKRLKYSEELRKVEYECVFGLPSKRYSNTLIPGSDDTEQTNNIMDYLCEETLVDTGITVPNPDYIPAVPESIKLVGTLGGSSYKLSCDDHTKYNKFMEEIIKTGIIEAISFAFKSALIDWNPDTMISSGIKDTITNKLASIWAQFYASKAPSDEELAWIISDFVSTASTGICKNYWEHLSEQGDFRTIIQLIKVPVGGIVPNINSTYSNRVFLNPKTSVIPTDISWCMIDFMIALIIFNTIKSNTWYDNNVVTEVFTSISETMSKEFSFVIEKFTRILNTSRNGLWCAIPNYGTYKDCEFNILQGSQAQGSQTIPVKETRLIARQSESTTDHLQRYNKILAFLIKKNHITQDASIYEWIYACYRYMPVSKSYINIGNRSFIGASAPTKAKMNEESNDNASNTSTTEQTNRLIMDTKQDMLDRIASFETEDALLNRMPRLKAILEQCFAEETVQGVTTYKLAGVPSTSSFNQLVARVNGSEANMVNMATAVNQGKRVVMTDGIIGASDDLIFSGATVNPQSQPSQDQAPAMETETIVEPNVTVQNQVNTSRSFTTSKRTISGSQQTVLTRAGRL